MIGLSTHTPAQVDAALDEPIDYIAVGPILRHRDEGHRLRCRRARPGAARARSRATRPIVAIGGITLATAPEVLAAGAASVAVISDLLADGRSDAPRRWISCTAIGVGIDFRLESIPTPLRGHSGRITVSIEVDRQPVVRRESEGRDGAQAHARPRSPWWRWASAAIIGAGLFVRTAAAIAERAGPSVTLALHRRRRRLRVRGPLLRRVRLDDPDRRAAPTPIPTRRWASSIAWIIGWDLVLEYAVGAATVAIAWSEYFNKMLEFIGIQIPYQWYHSPLRSVDADGVARDHEHPGRLHPARRCRCC